MKKLLLISLFLINSAHAAFMINTMSGYFSTTDSKTNTNTNDTTNHIFIGASLGSKQRFFVGQNITLFSHQIAATNTDKVSTMELGPRIIYFFTDNNVFYTTLGWNPYAKGTRTVSGTTEKVSGSALLFGAGVEVKINSNFHIGGSINYHSLSVTESTSASNVTTTVSQSYTALMPMINLSLRFR